jgi:predicted SnoaL-like aldol condensation-catalyzing enzyme
MSVDRNVAVIDEFVQAYNDERIDDAAAMYATDGRLRHVTRGIDIQGRDAIRKLMSDALEIVPGRRVDCVHIVAAGDIVVTEHHYEARDAQSNEPVTFDFCHIFRLKDGEIVDHKEYG